MSQKKRANSNAPVANKSRGHDPAKTAANKARRIFKEAERQKKAAEKRAVRAAAYKQEQKALALRTIFIRSMPHDQAVQLEIKDLIKRKEDADGQENQHPQ